MILNYPPADSARALIGTKGAEHSSQNVQFWLILVVAASFAHRCWLALCGRAEVNKPACAR